MMDKDLFGDPVKPPASSMLASRFGVPPFSVLSARDGDWQERKRRWLALGIKSELGRGENLQEMASSDLGDGLNACRDAKKNSAIPGGRVQIPSSAISGGT
jgi:alkylhydroperoxidase/carboxymuconolactone decarboxylase family protein YurZ